MSYSVGQVARFAGTTVRTLHHYDEIGLLTPSERNTAGHRRYGEADLDRLQQVLFYRELGFPLDEIQALLDDPASDPREHLRRQHELLTVRIEKLQKMAEAVEHAMEAQKMGIQLTPEERFEVFGDKDPVEYSEETEQRWGSTEAYAESQRRAATYSKEDWLRMKAENDDWLARYVALVTAGEPADGERAMDLAEEHRDQISQWFYDCPHEMHACLGAMYVADERFKAYYDALGEGVADHLSIAIHANSVRNG
ncbi:MerR family transcriptional regulator [Streptomyces sp. BH104]|uniref:MerR family transcriptional regulator n=1 Tax=Streptomyces sp. BH104 TaxID=3410407 RepID=UPI003BB5D0C5